MENAVNVGIIKEVGIRLLPMNAVQKSRDRYLSKIWAIDCDLEFRNFEVDEQNQAYVTIVEINGDNNSYKAEIDDWIDLNEMIKPAVIESGQGNVLRALPVYFLWQILDLHIENTN